MCEHMWHVSEECCFVKWLCRLFCHLAQMYQRLMQVVQMRTRYDIFFPLCQICKLNLVQVQALALSK
jgi:hypothetical protein